MRTIQAFIQLIELHQDTGIRHIERKSLFKQSNRLFLPIQLIEISQGKVTQDGREGIILLHGSLPAGDCFRILTLVVPQITQIIQGFRSFCCKPDNRL